jgi:glycosyltransferase involved in cell wall biosynthesis
VRVLFVTHSFPRHGGDVAGGFILGLARALGDRGVELLVLAPSAPGLEAREVIDSVPVQRFRYAPRERETLAYTGTMAEQVSESIRGKTALWGLLRHGRRAVKECMQSFAPDVVHAHWWFPSALFAAGALGGRPMVTTLHGSDVRFARTNRFAPPFFRRAVTRSRAVTAASSWLAREARIMAPALRVTVEPMPVNVGLFSPGGARSSARFLFVGRLNAQKGIGLLLEALAITKTGAALDVVGDGPDRAVLDVRAKALGISARVTFHGTLGQERLVDFYRIATAVVIPGEREGLGLVAVEAQLCEAPVIAFQSGGLPDVVTDGETGLLSPPGDVQALARTMDALLVREDRGAALGRAGRVASLARFSPAVVSARYEAIYLEVTRDR